MKSDDIGETYSESGENEENKEHREDENMEKDEKMENIEKGNNENVDRFPIPNALNEGRVNDEERSNIGTHSLHSDFPQSPVVSMYPGSQHSHSGSQDARSPSPDESPSDAPYGYVGSPIIERRAQYRTDLGDVGTRAVWEDEDLLADTEIDPNKTEIHDGTHRAPMIISDISQQFDNFFHNFYSPKAYGLPTDEGDDEYDDEELSFYGRKLQQFVEEELSFMGDLSENENSRNNISTKIENRCLKISLSHLEAFDNSLYFDIIQNPEQSCGQMDGIIVNKYISLHDSLSSFGETHIDPLTQFDLVSRSKDAPKVRLYDKPLKQTIRELSPMDIDCLISIQAMVIRCSEISPQMQIARFKCNTTRLITTTNNENNEHYINDNNRGYGTKIIKSRCPEFRELSVLQGEVVDPKRCNRCKNKECFRLDHCGCTFSSKQLVRVTELGVNVLQGETPQSMRIYLSDDLIDTVKPGDRIDITGVYKVETNKTVASMRTLNSNLRPYINALSLEQCNKDKVRLIDGENDTNPFEKSSKNLGETEDEGDETVANIGGIIFTSEMRKNMIRLSQEPDIYEKLTRSLAPTIIKKDDVKKGLLCQLFGGSQIFNEGKKRYGRFRKEIHILLCGDPSTGKSQLLQYVHKLAARGVFTSGKGSSSVGLTVSVGKDPDTKEFILESGAVVLSDKGICCIDEFDKMDDTARGVLHEVMEQQTVSVAKVGIVASLNARTSILASANPINSRYDRRRAVIENINLPASLFSRFDLVYLMLDQPDKENDKILSKGICKQFMDTDELKTDKNATVYLSQTEMAQYISFARAMSNPLITTRVKAILIDEYMKLRDPTNGKGGAVPTATSRQLEGLVRLSQGLAKMKLAKYVSGEDIKEAVRLCNVATYKTLMDPISGRLDFNQFNIGKSANQLQSFQRIQQAILQALSENRKKDKNGNSSSMTKDILFNNIKQSIKNGSYIEKNDFEDALHQLENDERSISRLLNGTFILAT